MKIILLLCLFGSLILGCGLISSPEGSYRQIIKYAEKKDWGAVYDSIDEYSKGQLDISLKMLVAFASAFSDDETRKEPDKLSSGRDLFIRMAGSEIGEESTDFIPKPDCKIIKTQRRDKKAILTVKNSSGELEEVTMVLEDSKWKLQLIDKKQEEKSLTKERKLTLADKTEKAKQEKLAKEAQEKEKAEREKLKQVVTVALVGKSFIESDYMRDIYHDYITIKLVLANESDKDIRAIKGILIFKDIFGDEIQSVGFKYDGGIKAHSKVNWSGEIQYNQFRDNHRELRATELKNLIFEWEPQTILFEDGSKLGE